MRPRRQRVHDTAPNGVLGATRGAAAVVATIGDRGLDISAGYHDASMEVTRRRRDRRARGAPPPWPAPIATGNGVRFLGRSESRAVAPDVRAVRPQVPIGREMDGLKLAGEQAA
jgi:hypothetical protein